MKEVRIPGLNYFPLLLSLCFDWQGKSNTRDSVSSGVQTPRISSNTPLRVVFSTLLSMFQYLDETLSLMFDILRLKSTEKFKNRPNKLNLIRPISKISKHRSILIPQNVGLQRTTQPNRSFKKCSQQFHFKTCFICSFLVFCTSLYNYVNSNSLFIA